MEKRGLCENKKKYQMKKIKLKKKCEVSPFSPLTSRKRFIFEAYSSPLNKKSNKELKSKVSSILSEIALPHSQEKKKKKKDLSREMSDEFLLKIRNAKEPGVQITIKNFKKQLMRDFEDDYMNNPSNSKRYYEKQDEILHYQKEKMKKDSMLLIKNFNERKNATPFFSRLNRSKSTRHQSSLGLSSFDLSDLMYRQSKKKYEEETLKKIKLNSKEISEAILHLDSKEYQKFHSSSERFKVANSNLPSINCANLERKIKIYNISKYHFDLDTDDLCEKNGTLLKKLLSQNEEVNTKLRYLGKPSYIKHRLKNSTIQKYAGFSGTFFGI